MEETKKYEVIATFDLDGAHYEPGHVLELTAEEAAKFDDTQIKEVVEEASAAEDTSASAGEDTAAQQ